MTWEWTLARFLIFLEDITPVALIVIVVVLAIFLAVRIIDHLYTISKRGDA